MNSIRRPVPFWESFGLPTLKTDHVNVDISTRRNGCRELKWVPCNGASPGPPDATTVNEGRTATLQPSGLPAGFSIAIAAAWSSTSIFPAALKVYLAPDSDAGTGILVR